jgi:hypothetical protein
MTKLSNQVRESLGLDPAPLRTELERLDAIEESRARGQRAALHLLAYLLTPFVWCASKFTGGRK